ncbi:MAG: MBOAT family protein [Lachnospiraceae bacterium]|nr:MBOAT family protein [Lachnospiraceae bacterium]
MFQAISYVIDVSRGTVAAQKNLLYVGLYIAFFPQLIAGPIVRYEAISEQIFHRKENFSLFATGVNKFIFGLAKKVIIANNLAIVSDYAFSMVVDRVYHGSTLMAWLGAISYMLQIFFDFSGYSDMAVGLAAMFGFHIDDNFNYPYISKSLSEFWRRWHISLQTWLNDYLYIPLGKKHTSTPLRNYLNIFIVWLFSGLWHGADWSFVLWDLYNCLFIIYEKKRGKWDIGHIYTLLVILFSWVIFRSNTTYDAFVYLAAMFGKSQYGMIDPTAVAYLQQHGIYYLSAILFSAPFIPKLALLLQQNRIWNLAYTFAQLFLLCVCIIFVLNQAYDPFIYYNF